MKIAAGIVSSLAFAGALLAQTTSPITAYELQIYRAADSTTGTPFQTSAIALSEVTCNLAPTPPPPTPPVNPRFFEWDDPAIAGRACRVNRAAFVQALPAATGYQATITALSAVGPSARSNVAGPFAAAPVPPAAPMDLGVRP